MNSWVPNVFGSTTPPQFGLRVTFRRAPIPFRQWYSSAKQPRPADVRHLYCFECGHNIIANTTGVWNWRIRAHPDAVINTVPQMLGELTEDVAVDLCARFGRVNRQLNFLGSYRRRSQGETHKSDGEQNIEPAN